MSGSEKAHPGLTRRNFLKATGAAAGVAAVAGATTIQALGATDAGEDAQEEVYSSFCRCNCGTGGCTYNLTVREGNIVSITPRVYPDADPETKGRSRSCFRGLSNMQREYNPNRVLYPLRRKEGTERGAGEWERVSWEEAIEEIADKWQRYIDEFGGKSIAKWATFGNLAALNGAYGLCWARLQYFLGMSTLEHGADWAGMYTPAFFLGQVQVGCTAPGMVGHTKTYIDWGANSCESQPHEWRFVCDAREQGCRLVVVDPRVSITAAKADYHYRVRPASDAALGMGLSNYYIENNLYDVEFLKSTTDAALLVCEDTGLFLRAKEIGLAEDVAASSEGDNATYGGVVLGGGSAGNINDFVVKDSSTGEFVRAGEAVDPVLEGSFEVQGRKVSTAFSLFKERVSEWSLARTAEVCDLGEDEIVELATLIADGPTLMHWNYGFGHYTNSHHMVVALIGPMLLTGNFAKPGAGFNYTTYKPFTSNSIYGYPEMDPSIAEGGFVGSRGPAYAGHQLPEIVKDGVYAGEPATIKSVIYHSANPVGNASGRTDMLAALKGIEFVVVVDYYLTDTARYADLVLPAAFWYETNDFSNPSVFPYVSYDGKAIEPLGEAKTDFDICREIGTAMGYGEYFQDDALTVLDGFLDGCENYDADGKLITMDRLKAERDIRTMPDDYYDGMDGTFPTITSRLHFYCEAPVQRLNYGVPIDVELEHLPYFELPNEAWPESAAEYGANPLADQYPLVCFSMHQRWNTHTTYRLSQWIEEMMPEPVVSINPDDARERGISEGDLVRVFNDRGYVVVKARLDSGMRPGSINIPHGWQEDQFVEGHYTDLTNRASHPFDSNDCYYDCLVEVSKYEGGAA